MEELSADAILVCDENQAQQEYHQVNWLLSRHTQATVYNI